MQCLLGLMTKWITHYWQVGLGATLFQGNVKKQLSRLNSGIIGIPCTYESLFIDISALNRKYKNRQGKKDL